MLISKGLSYQYNGGLELIFPDIECNVGENVLILGQSGCGKTTLLNLIGGLLKIQKGELFIKNTSIKELSTREMDVFRGKHIGFVFQKPHFIASINVLENVMMASKFTHEKQSRERAIELLDKLGIRQKAYKLPSTLSSGEQQRASIARAMFNKPALILADEPTSALDDFHCQQVIGLLEKSAKEEGATLIVVTHDQRIKDVFSKQINL
jgi:ABC-type lipoprotein export system ATPase subunit